ncbi:polysaccharide biosynthesis/export family protein [Altererythrobacter fulvus]|uniref:polysaccharide biosynthesis/export family protein n=1 Tax=Caenibius fulvus TaxID=2126012 RepID=UPI00301B52A9
MRSSEESSYAEGDIQIVELNDLAVNRTASLSRARSFAEVFGDRAPTDTVIGTGDIVDIALWEAPPAVLFGATSVDARLAANPMMAQSASIPQQVVGGDGTISIPFIGSVPAAGRTPAQLQREIVSRLSGKAHDPQAIVRLVQNEARNVTILGEVAVSRRVPLSARGERLLDALAAAGGPKQPVGKTTVQLSRGTAAASMALDAIIKDPAQNVRLSPDDVVTVLFQPYSFIALGAVNQNAEVPFEGAGLTLAQALGRIGGLRDERADIRGVFVFRLEDPAALAPEQAAAARQTADGKIPVIYRLNLADASSFFTAQNFAIRDDDVLYVSNAPAVDLQKFLTTVSNAAFSVIAVGNSLN